MNKLFICILLTGIWCGTLLSGKDGASALSNEKRVGLSSGSERWQKLDVKRNLRDEASQGDGTGRSGFITGMENGRKVKFQAYLKNMALLDEIEKFPIRHDGKTFHMQNGELDRYFPASDNEPAHFEPFAIIVPSTVRKCVIGNEVWHIAVFVPDYLIIHEMKHGGCLVAWKNGEHVASFTWGEDFDIAQIGMTATKKVKIVGEAYLHDEPKIKKSMVFDLATPNGKELEVNY